MKEQIKKILTAEENAEKLLEEGRQKAQDIISKAKEEAKQLFDNTIKEADAQAREIIKKGEHEAEIKRVILLKEAKNKIQKMIQDKTKGIDKSCDLVVKKVIEVNI